MGDKIFGDILLVHLTTNNSTYTTVTHQPYPKMHRSYASIRSRSIPPHRKDGHPSHIHIYNRNRNAKKEQEIQEMAW